MSEQLEKAIDEAKETCDDGNTADCAVAWDNVSYSSYVPFSFRRALFKKENRRESGVRSTKTKQAFLLLRVFVFIQVEEISAEISHKKSQKKVDPLEDFCDDNPEADECRVYED